MAVLGTGDVLIGDLSRWMTHNVCGVHMEQAIRERAHPWASRWMA